MKAGSAIVQSIAGMVLAANAAAQLSIEPQLDVGVSGTDEAVSGFLIPALLLDYQHPLITVNSSINGNWTAGLDQSPTLESWQSANAVDLFATNRFYELGFYQQHRQSEDPVASTERIQDSVGVTTAVVHPLSETLLHRAALSWDYTRLDAEPQAVTEVQRVDLSYALTWRVSPDQTQSLDLSGRLTDADQQTLRLGWQFGYRLSDTELSAALNYSLTRTPEGDDDGIEGSLGMQRPVWIGDLALQWRRSILDSVTALTIDGVDVQADQSSLVTVNQIITEFSNIRTGDRSQASVGFTQTQTSTRLSVAQLSDLQEQTNRVISLGWSVQGRGETLYSIGYDYSQNDVSDRHQFGVDYQTSLNPQWAFTTGGDYRWPGSENMYEWRLGLTYRP
ncbi:hypothetical protein [Reinekea blandensis]|uniref:Uncharacterized protein n=1 Tax=Reinekea blandensis MED297 TaxID=314283 RepID=A4B968_9GAMM|nr:hypothetical protein [Reinekea blandensis]EAR11169.1 hypothetical protein MED297_19817 [Reinekea sp. MED297] [Reinekea blandensis MED297]